MPGYVELSTKLRLAGLFAGGPALFHESGEFGACGGAHRPATSPFGGWSRCCGRLDFPRSSGAACLWQTVQSFQGVDGFRDAFAFGFEVLQDGVYVHVLSSSSL